MFPSFEPNRFKACALVEIQNFPIFSGALPVFLYSLPNPVCCIPAFCYIKRTCCHLWRRRPQWLRGPPPLRPLRPLSLTPAPSPGPMRRFDIPVPLALNHSQAPLTKTSTPLFFLASPNMMLFYGVIICSAINCFLNRTALCCGLFFLHFPVDFWIRLHFCSTIRPMGNTVYCHLVAISSPIDEDIAGMYFNWNKKASVGIRVRESNPNLSSPTMSYTSIALADICCVAINLFFVIIYFLQLTNVWVIFIFGKCSRSTGTLCYD